MRRQPETAGDLHAWAEAHGGGRVFRPGLLAVPELVVLWAHDGDTAAGGAVASRSGQVVGVSNVFSATDPDRVWQEIAVAVAAHFPGLPLVGYEHGDSLAAARRAGFCGVGPLRVWLAD